MGNLVNATSTETQTELQQEVEEVKTYCRRLLRIRFYGQTTSVSKNAKQDKSVFSANSVNNLGHKLNKLDAVVRKKPPAEFNDDDEEINKILKEIASDRRQATTEESEEECYNRLKKDCKTFGELYRNRDKHSESLSEDNATFWGSRQQMLFGKVVTDWIFVASKVKRKSRTSQKKKPKLPNIEPIKIDPIFGVLLNPTGGRVGPGDTGWFHDFLYDDYGKMAFHSAVHDGFGYLKSTHDTGPGYDYLEGDFLSDKNPMAGQLSGISFWQQVIEEEPDDDNDENFEFE